MGYYTYYSLDYKEKGTPSLDKKVVDVLCKINEDYFDPYKEKEVDIDDFFYEEMKWYSHEQDMRELSTIIPNTLFTLEGHGEEYGDIWIEYYLNGKMQHSQAEIVFDEFDERRMN